MRFSAPALWLVDGVARYFAEAVIGAVPGARWRAGNAGSKGYVHQNHPVVTGLPADDMEPMWTVLICAAHALNPTGHPSDLLSLFDNRVTGIA